MKLPLILLVSTTLLSCTTWHQQAQYLSAPRIRLETLADASVEDYILAIPTSRISGQSPESFRRQVLAARRLPPNRHRHSDQLFLPADSTYPARTFTLDRSSNTLRVDFENAKVLGGTTHRYRRLPTYWNFWVEDHQPASQPVSRPKSKTSSPTPPQISTPRTQTTSSSPLPAKIVLPRLHRALSSPNPTFDDLQKILGDPPHDIGSGLYVFVYPLDDRSQITLSTPDRRTLLSVRHNQQVLFPKTQ